MSTAAQSVMAPEQFAALVKQKYPAYKDIPDDQLVQAVITKHPEYKSSVAAPTAKPNVSPVYHDIVSGQPGDAASAQGAGAMKGITGDAAAIFSLLNKIPGMSDFFNQEKLAQMKEFSQPANRSEALGKGVEQVGEMVAGPGAAASKLGMAGKVGKAAEIGTRAAATGAINKVQGGDFTTGAALSAGGDILSGLGGAMKAGRALKEAPDELTQASNLIGNVSKNLKNYKNTDVKNAVSAFKDAVKAGSVEEAIANVEEVHQTLMKSNPGMAEKTGDLYNKLMKTLQGSVEMGQAGKVYSKADQIAEILKRHAIYSGAGAMAGGAFGYSPEDRLRNAMFMGAAGMAAPSVMRQMPNALTALPPIMRSAPAVKRAGD